MRRLLPSLCLYLLISHSVDSQSQNVTSTQVVVVRDAQAIDTIQQSIVALGGPKVLAQVQAVLAQGSIAPAPGTSGPAGSFSFEDQFTSQGHEFKDSFRSALLNQNFVSGHGSPGVVSNGHTKSFMPHVAAARLAVHLPITILAGLLADPNCSVAFVGPTQVNGLPAIQIHVHNDTDFIRQILSVQDWYFDPVTALPLRVEYRIPDAANPQFFVNAAAEFSDFRTIQGLLIPFRIVAFTDGVPLNTLTLTSVTINQPASPSDFDLPTAVAQ